MNTNKRNIVAIFLALQVNVVHAAESTAAKDKMIQALAASASGKCAEEIMSPMLLDACEHQIDANKELLAPLGKIIGATFRGTQEFPGGNNAEAYRVAFEHGSMMWYASLDGAGKLLVLWSNGQVQPK